MIDLDGKRALVTGGSRGIGAAIALVLAENGADVAFTYQHSAERAQAVAKSIDGTGRRAIPIQADSANPNAITRAVSHAVSALGGLDILVNSAAIGHALTSPPCARNSVSSERFVPIGLWMCGRTCWPLQWPRSR